MTGTDGLLDATEKAIIAQHLPTARDNASNRPLSGRSLLAQRKTMDLQNGDTADYFVSTGGFEINIHDKV